MQDKDKPLWRSMLYVPATSEKFIEKAHERCLLYTSDAADE